MQYLFTGTGFVFFGFFLHHRQFSLSVIFQVQWFPNCIHWFVGQATFVVCILLFSHFVTTAADNVGFFYGRIICLRLLRLSPSTKEWAHVWHARERLMDNVPLANSFSQDKPSPQLWENGSKFFFSGSLCLWQLRTCLKKGRRVLLQTVPLFLPTDLSHFYQQLDVLSSGCNRKQRQEVNRNCFLVAFYAIYFTSSMSEHTDQSEAQHMNYSRFELPIFSVFDHWYE